MIEIGKAVMKEKKKHHRKKREPDPEPEDDDEDDDDEDRDRSRNREKDRGRDTPGRDCDLRQCGVVCRGHGCSRTGRDDMTLDDSI